MEIIQEGNVKFYASKDEAGKISKELEVFYNPLMKTNRDVNIVLLNALNQKDMQMCDLMAGSGVRSLRFLKELNPGIIKSLVVNDYDANFPKLFKKNMLLNDIKYDKEDENNEDNYKDNDNEDNEDNEDKIIIKNIDANQLLIESKGFDYIDIDPFGSPNNFLDNAIVRLSRKGILAVTATDTAPLAGTFLDACMRNYWAKPLRNYLMHETGLRILIRKIQLIGTQHDRALIPILAYYKNHYFRIIFKSIKSKTKCDELLKQHKYLLFDGLDVSVSETILDDKKAQYAGPLWTGSLQDKNLTKNIIESNNNSDIDWSFIMLLKQELDMVGFYDIHKLSRIHKFTIPNFEKLIIIIQSKGHTASRTHFSGYGIKTSMKIDDLVRLIKQANLSN